MSNNLNSKRFGTFLLSIGVVSILAFIFLLIFFVGYFNDIPSILFFGPLNDIFGSLVAVLSAVLATVFISSQSKQWSWLYLIGAILSWIGVFIVTLDSLMAGGIISTASASILRIKYGFPALLTTHNQDFGFGLIGIWLIMVIIQASQTRSWPNHLIGLGLFAGVLMMVGLAGSNGALGFVFIYPIWCIWLGRYILKSKQADG
jgi:hypothetical protein